jgi:Flp pilus assembly protein TadD
MRTILLSLAVLVLAAPAFAADGDAAKLFADGEKLLKAGKFAEAAEAFTAASRAAPDNAEYKTRALVVRRVIALRKQVDTAEPDAKWERMLVSLHVFYCDHDLLDTALTMNRAANARAGTATTAALVAETLLDLGRNGEASEFLAALPEGQRNDGNRLLLGISLARLGKTDEAKAAVAGLEVTEETGAGAMYDHARLACLLGEPRRAVELLVKSIETSSPKTAERLKKYVGKCSDFSLLAKDGNLEKVLAAESKVAESGCSGGSGCGSCPSRGSCGGDEKKGTEKKDGCGGCGEDKTDG